MVDGGNAYSLAYVEHILNMSLTGSSRLETSSSVPFMAMVLHGYINYAGSASNMASNMDQEILHMLENGASPYFIIATQNTRYLKENQRLSKYYSLDFDAWEEDLVSTYNTVNDVLKDVKYANFIGHNSISGVRVPDADEVLADRATIIAAAIANIQKYQTYQERYERALALYERKVNAGVADCEKELAELLAANGFDDATAAHSAAALTAAFYSGIKLVRDEESYVYKDFWKSFKMNFVQGLLLEIVHGVIGFLLFIDLRASVQWGLVQGSQIGTLFIFVVIGVMAIWVGIMLYSFAMLSRYDNKLIGTLKNSLIICMHHLPQTIIMLIATVGLIYFSCIYFTAFIVTIPLILYVDSYIFSSIFKKLEKDMVKKDEPEVIGDRESEDIIEDTTDNKEE